jgi:hypothetical protein
VTGIVGRGKSGQALAFVLTAQKDFSSAEAEYENAVRLFKENPENVATRLAVAIPVERRKAPTDSSM